MWVLIPVQNSKRGYNQKTTKQVPKNLFFLKALADAASEI